jgi:hypothetical protein
VRPLPNKQIASSVNYQQGLLLLAFDRDEPHGWAALSLAMAAASAASFLPRLT